MLGSWGLQKGCRFYEGLVRVPLIFCWPGRFQRNLQSPALVELLDKSATILELAGLPLPDYFQGRSLLPILRGEASPEHHRDFVRCEYFDALAAEFVGSESPDPAQPPAHGTLPGAGAFATMYRDQRYKLSVYHSHHLGELYDLQDDPWEFNNLWDSPQHQEQKHRLLHASFDATMLTTVDVGSRRIAPM